MIRSAPMWRSSEPNRQEHFQQWLDRLARPIEFASRDAFAHLPTVKNLNSFVSSQVMQALSDRVYPRSIEAALLKLRALFSEDQQRLTTIEQQRRLREAAAILGTLREAARDQAGAWQESELRESSSQQCELWNLPIRFAKGVGPKRSSVLQRLRIETVEDALWTVPWRYEDRSVMTCTSCHSTPPLDGSHGKKHGDYFGTSTESCSKCHSNHLAEASSFAHASVSANPTAHIRRRPAAPGAGGLALRRPVRPPPRICWRIRRAATSSTSITGITPRKRSIILAAANGTTGTCGCATCWSPHSRRTDTPRAVGRSPVRSPHKVAGSI